MTRSNSKRLGAISDVIVALKFKTNPKWKMVVYENKDEITDSVISYEYRVSLSAGCVKYKAKFYYKVLQPDDVIYSKFAKEIRDVQG